MIVVGGLFDMMQGGRLSTAQTDSAEAARPLRWWSAAQLDVLASRAQILFDQWRGDWGLPVGQGEAGRCVKAVPAHPDAVQGDRRWMALSAGDGASGTWWTVRPQAHSRAHTRLGPKAYEPSAPDAAGGAIRMVLFGEDANPAGQSGSLVASGVGNDAVKDWCLRLRHWLGAVEDGEVSSPTEPLHASLPIDLTQFWSGAVLLKLDWYGDIFQLVIDCTHVMRLIGPCAATTDGEATERRSEALLTPVLSALSAEPLSMTAELNPIELELGTLTGLQVGDVIRIPHALEMPLLVRADDGELLYQAFLGRLEDQKAIELFPLTQTSQV
ncbi:FliM/FliN family flagellar motor switch protein [Ralstonia solanacearum]|uniref:FliM/FliN family flagellar motor C-terminal domain-containing protein n=1 Tax=Ralstonia solanacearum TaxID=305 RepID=A0A7X0Q3F4_RALSL|nr:FliM/FliN family flagellar motor C-terminal domain-containing protein [Ralstonia solanacearum]MBB6581995.1 FliM/FliN family flagellar motor switch protein [Ralstonia solanacearum]MBB6584636.1 FliM/FliN family flagellar motor switch protein [Ralstonia solanacearum]MDB0524629.1 FliM/FliN family flagellar motor C-terminal domain-containing protein [Ralstonia solanacearum]